MSRELEKENSLLRKENEELARSNKMLADANERFVIENRKVHNENLELRSAHAELIKEADKLKKALSKAIATIKSYQEQMHHLLNPKVANYAIFFRPHPGSNPEERSIDILVDGALLKTTLAIPDKLPGDLKCGWEVLLNNKSAVVAITKDYWQWGTEVILKEKPRGDVALVSSGTEGVQQCFLSPELKGQPLKIGDSLLNCGGLLVKILQKIDGQEHFLDLEELKDLTFAQVGGLSKQIQEIKEALLPFEEPEVYREKLKGRDAPRGILLDGPPGCGKTLLAKVIGSTLARQRGIKGYFMGLTSTDIGSKYVYETEGRLKQLVSRAQERAKDGNLVVIFIDEIDSLTRQASDKEPWKDDTRVAFCGILDGIKPLGDIIFIGATNHKTLIDPAIMRPGRMSVHINVPRPNRRGAEEILRLYLTPDLPFGKKYLVDNYEYVDHFDGGEKKVAVFSKDSEKIRDHFMEMVLKRIFYKGPPFKLAVQDAVDGETLITVDNHVEILNETGIITTYLKDHVSGDMLANIVEKAKRLAHSRDKQHRENNPGSESEPELIKKDFFLAVEAEYKRITSSFKKASKKDKTQLGFIRESQD